MQNLPSLCKDRNIPSLIMSYIFKHYTALASHYQIRNNKTHKIGLHNQIMFTTSQGIQLSESGFLFTDFKGRVIKPKCQS